MAGTKGKSGGKRAGTGGKRTGSGRKSKYEGFSEEFVGRLSSYLEAKEKETGKHAAEVLVDMVYDEKVSPSVRKECLKIIAGTLTVKRTHKTVEKKEYGPIILPELNTTKDNDNTKH